MNNDVLHKRTMALTIIFAIVGFCLIVIAMGIGAGIAGLGGMTLSMGDFIEGGMPFIMVYVLILATGIVGVYAGKKGKYIITRIINILLSLICGILGTLLFLALFSYIL